MLHSRLLTYLDEVARTGSIRRAAQQLNVASSAVNRQILALERELGTPLFIRLHKRLRLTAAGELIIAHVRQTLKEHERVLGQIEDLKGLRHGSVSIATMYTLAGELLPSVVKGFAARHPRVEVNIRVIINIAEAVLASDADLGVGFNLPVDAGLRVYAAVPVTFGAVVAPGHPLAGRKSITIAGCASHPLIMHDAGMSFRPMLDRALGQLHGDIRIASTTNSIDFMKRGARAGLGVAFLSRVNVLDEMARGELVYIPLTDPPLPQDRLMIICRARDVLSGVSGLLAEELRLSMERVFAPEPPAD